MKDKKEWSAKKSIETVDKILISLGLEKSIPANKTGYTITIYTRNEKNKK